MCRDVRDYIRNCDVCKQVKPVNYLLKPPIGNFKEVVRPWQHIYVDFIGPYPRTGKNNCFIFIVLDKYSKYVLLKPMPEATSNRVIDFLESSVFNFFSVPETVFSDNGRQFESKLFAESLKIWRETYVYTIT